MELQIPTTIQILVLHVNGANINIIGITAQDRVELNGQNILLITLYLTTQLRDDAILGPNNLVLFSTLFEYNCDSMPFGLQL